MNDPETLHRRALINPSLPYIYIHVNAATNHYLLSLNVNHHYEDLEPYDPPSSMFSQAVGHSLV
jgi:hypothetical protein